MLSYRLLVFFALVLCALAGRDWYLNIINASKARLLVDNPRPICWYRKDLRDPSKLSPGAQHVYHSEENNKVLTSCYGADVYKSLKFDVGDKWTVQLESEHGKCGINLFRGSHKYSETMGCEKESEIYATLIFASNEQKIQHNFVREAPTERFFLIFRPDLNNTVFRRLTVS